MKGKAKQLMEKTTKGKKRKSAPAKRLSPVLVYL